MKSLIIGMGIGMLYKQILLDMGHEVVTLDTNPAVNADYTSLIAVFADHRNFDTVHICSPNSTHFSIAMQVAPVARIVFIEKPGVENSVHWATLVSSFPQTRFMMVKNNMWRDNINEMRRHVRRATHIKLNWINKNRIPGPGTWFTTKKLAFGGVSRDLMPHLLSLYIVLNDEWETSQCTGQEALQMHTLANIEDTEYGAVNRDGIYDVDDRCKLKYMQHGKTWELEANWADGKEDNRSIEFELGHATIARFELGLCPEDAYNAMIVEAIGNIDNEQFWQKQLAMDIWIHTKVEQF